MTTDSSSAPSFQTHASFSEIADSYQGFILDQFGVLHDGTCALDGAVDCVERLKEMGKKLIILSNSSSASAATITKLPKLGFDSSNFLGAVTSGEECSQYVRETYPNNKKALWITWSHPKTPSPSDFLDKCGDISVVGSAEEADFVLLHGAEVIRGPGKDGEAEETSLGSFPTTGDMSQVIEPLLKTCLKRKLPMVCANPDFVMVKHDGSQAHMPGASMYERRGSRKMQCPMTLHN
jgi:ribonucleotide monophosphatase NagD (HAD superfamily)